MGPTRSPWYRIVDRALLGVVAVFSPAKTCPWHLIFLSPTAGRPPVGHIIPHFADETAGQEMDEVIQAIQEPTRTASLSSS